MGNCILFLFVGFISNIVILFICTFHLELHSFLDCYQQASVMLRDLPGKITINTFPFVVGNVRFFLLVSEVFYFLLQFSFAVCTLSVLRFSDICVFVLADWIPPGVFLFIGLFFISACFC